ncbi:P1 family peptidase [Nonomuraea rubra]|uniref:P1 family peptidase n=1 Tax=Nonomuraea rubra TaxID=46180 RepID=UPI0036214CE9
MRAGATNSLVDVAGLRVGHARRVGHGFRTGTTVVLAPAGGAVAGVDVRGPPLGPARRSCWIRGTWWSGCTPWCCRAGARSGCRPRAG